MKRYALAVAVLLLPVGGASIGQPGPGSTPGSTWGVTGPGMTANLGTASSCAKMRDFDSPTKPPEGMPGFAAVNSVSDRCRIARERRYGISGR